MKNEKKIGAEIGMGYCPIVLQKGKEIVLQYSHCIAEKKAGGEWKLYCNTGNCIAVRHLCWAGSVLQYTGLYCREEG